MKNSRKHPEYFVQAYKLTRDKQARRQISPLTSYGGARWGSPQQETRHVPGLKISLHQGIFSSMEGICKKMSNAKEWESLNYTHMHQQVSWKEDLFV